MSTEIDLLIKHYPTATKENHDLFRTTGEIEIAQRKETDGMIKISSHQLGKALRMHGFTRDNKYSKGKKYPIKARYLNFRTKI